MGTEAKKGVSGYVTSVLSAVKSRYVYMCNGVQEGKTAMGYIE
jgi:hypothetical protein